jgi:uncharacterized membrane protein
MLFDGMEVHTVIVHFPIALGVVGAIALLAYAIWRMSWLRWFAPALLTLALLGAGAAYFSGTSAEDRAEHIGVPEKALDEHEEAGLWAIGVLALATLLTWASVPKGRGVWVAAILALAAAGAVVRAGHLGGKLVFGYGAGRIAGSPAATGHGGATAPVTGGAAERAVGHDEGGDGD